MTKKSEKVNESQIDFLKPCPFCGADAVLFEVKPIWWYAQCTDCRCYQVSHFKNETISKWNKRVKE